MEKQYFSIFQMQKKQLKKQNSEELEEIQVEQNQRLKAKNILDQVLLKESAKSIQNRIYGCVLGAFIGDSLGSYCEFSSNSEAKSLIKKTMTMPGGGTFRINPAQLTDDSELALAQSLGLIKGKGKLDVKEIATEYANWAYSEPFDIGITMGSAFRIKNKSKAEKECFQNSQYYNQNSLSNGCLMKITPLAIFCHKLSPNEIFKAVQQDINLTHPNPIASEACYIWVQSIVDLINSNEEDISKKAQKAYSRAEEWVNDICQEKFIQEWWLEEVVEEKFRSANIQMGFMRIAWTYGYIFLKKIAEQKQEIPQNPQDIYKYVLSFVISKGGDTDTNACIVGGLIGALIGVQNVPNLYLEKLLNCSVISETQNNETKQFQKNRCIVRPIKYSPYNGILNTQQLFEMAPTNLLIKNGNNLKKLEKNLQYKQ